MSALLLPPCVVVSPSSDQAATFVAKVHGHEALATFGAAELVQGAGAFAVVHLPLQDDWYFVVSFAEVRSIPKYATKLTKQIGQLPGEPTVQWVRAFTRRFQRLCGFGDAAVARQDFKAACERGDSDELIILAPEAAAFIAQASDFSIVPAVCDGLRSGLPALQDCAHELWYGKPLQGPCSRGGGRAVRTFPVRRGDHLGPFARCVECSTVFCHFCVADVEEAAEDRKGLAEAVRLAKSLPRPPDAAEIHWRQHPTRPMPFKVIDQVKVPQADKLGWIQSEIGCDAALTEFAVHFLELFGTKLRVDWSQKAACLKLFATYSGGAGAVRESDLAPDELMAFQRVWDPKAPARCLECGNAIREATDYYESVTHCSDECANAGKTIWCTTCDVEGEMTHTVPVCVECGAGVQLAQRIGDELACTGRLGWDSQSLRNAYTLWGFDHAFVQKPNPGHVPAWKKRRRS